MYPHRVMWIHNSDTLHKNGPDHTLTLKSGCKAEDVKLRTADRLVNLIAILCLLSWRFFWMTILNRTRPEASPYMALTPTEILAAWEAGADCVKVFPASAMGGPAYLRSLRGPLPQVALMPMGGVTLATAAEYLDAGAWALGVGADLVRQATLDEGRDADLTEGARSFCRVIAGHGKTLSARG